MRVVCCIIRDDGRQTRALCNTDEAQKGSMVQALARSLFLLSSYIKKNTAAAAYHGQCFFLRLTSGSVFFCRCVTKTAS